MGTHNAYLLLLLGPVLDLRLPLHQPSPRSLRVVHSLNLHHDQLLVLMAAGYTRQCRYNNIFSNTTVEKLYLKMTSSLFKTVDFETVFPSVLKIID